MFCGEAMTTVNITRDILHRQIRVSKQMAEHPVSAIYQQTDNLLLIYNNYFVGANIKILYPTKRIVYIVLSFIVYKSLMETLIHVFRTREHQASKGPIM